MYSSKLKLQLLLNIIIFSIILTFVKSDLPIHCLNSQVAGKWVFELSEDNSDSSETCGYLAPDKHAQHFTEKKAFEFNVAKKLRITLRQPNIVEDDNENRGTWTMVYDEGFEVKLNNRIYFAFSKYVPKSRVNLLSEDVRDYESICYETMTGWYHSLDKTRWGCWRGYQPEKTSVKNALQNDEPLPKFRRVVNVVSPIPRTNDDTLFEHNVAFIEAVNSDKNSMWQAHLHEQFIGKRLSEMMRLLGQRNYQKGHKGSFPNGRRHKHHKARAKIDLRSDNEKYGNLPKDFSWTNKDGVNYDSPVRNQGECGSCYAVAVVYAFESRLRIKTDNKDTRLFSPQSVVSCSRYNQGCDGGYPILVGKHGEEFGFVPESCFPYEGLNSNCNKQCRGAEARFVENHHYIGGYYGGCSEVEMMKEIYKNGPIVVAFEAPSTLFYYKGGIFTGPSPKSDGVRENGVAPWEQTNHAVVAVGWGVDENGAKYWQIKNTWGIHWGENGYFRIRRGTDECAIESMASAFDVVA